MQPTNVSDLERALFALSPEAEPHVEGIVRACSRYGIDTPARQAMFLAICAHESDGFTRTALGLIPLTSEIDQRAFSRDYFGDERLANVPEWLSKPPLAALSAGWRWEARGMNDVADRGDVGEVSRLLTGSSDDPEGRATWWTKAKRALGIETKTQPMPAPKDDEEESR